MFVVYKHKQIIALLVLVSFLTVVFLGLAVMMHQPDGRMQNDCPFSAMGASLCPQDVVAMAFHHVSAYNSFFNIPMRSGIASFIIFSLLFAGAILMIFRNVFTVESPRLVGVRYDSPPPTSWKRKIARWLALHENSPSAP